MPQTTAEELRERANHYRRLAEAEPPGDMQDMLMQVVAALEDYAAVLEAKQGDHTHSP